MDVPQQQEPCQQHDAAAQELQRDLANAQAVLAIRQVALCDLEATVKSGITPGTELEYQVISTRQSIATLQQRVRVLQQQVTRRVQDCA